MGPPPSTTLDNSTGSDDLDSSETRLLLPPSPPSQPSPHDHHRVVRLRIKTVSDAVKEHPIDIDGAASVAELKALVSKTINAEGKFLRLIVQGKLLQPDTAIVSSFKLDDRAFVHCVVSERPPQPQIVQIEEDDVLEYPEAEEDPATRRGFDRLRNQGFTLQEVAAIRSYFGPQVVAYATLQPVTEGEADLDRRYRMEEEWMARQGETSEFAVNTLDRESGGRTRFITYRGSDDDQRYSDVTSSGSSREFMWGFIMGFALGFICLFWLWNIPMSHQQKMGILAGVSCQLGWSIIRKQAWGEQS